MTLLFAILIVLMTVCIFAIPHIAIFWTIALAICPIFALLLYTKPTLRTSQSIFSVVFALAYATLAVFFANSIVAGKRFFPQLQDWYFPIVASIFLAFSCVVSLALCRTKHHYRLFAIGVLFAIAHCCIPQNSVALCIVAYCLLTISATLISAAAAILHKQMKRAAKVLKVADKTLRLTAFGVAIAAVAINLFFSLLLKFGSPNVVRIAALSSNIVCAVVDFVLLFCYLRHPLEEVAQHKIALLENPQEGVDNQLVQQQLKQCLDETHIYPLGMALKKFLGMFFRNKVVGLQKVQGNAVFVANHYEIYGPFITALKFPLPFRPWTDSLMTDKKTLTRQLRSGVEVSTRKWLPKCIRRRLPPLIASPLWNLLQFARVLPIYRNNPEKIERMMNESVTALKTGDSLIIFPEKPPAGELYKDGGVDDFQTGFVEVGSAYKNSTGRDVAFFPLYVDKRGKKMIVGDKVTFDDSAPLHEEKIRVAQKLHDQMVQMSQQCQNRK